MAFADDVVIKLATAAGAALLVADFSAASAGTFYSVRTEYSYYQDVTDELGGVALSGALAYPPVASAATNQDITFENGWYRTQGSHKRSNAGSTQTDGYDSAIYVLEFASGGYTNATGTWGATEDDLGKVVTNGAATGLLLDYDNTERKWWVRVTSGTFANSDSITITSGTGAGTVLSSGGVSTGEEGFSNAFGLGDVNHWEATYFSQGSTVYDLVTGGWYAAAPTGAFDIQIKIQEAGVQIDSGNAIFYNRCNRDLANSIDSSTTGDTYDWFQVSLGNYGANPVPLNTRPDLSDTLTNAQAEDYLDGTTSTIAAATAGAPYSVDINQDGSTEDYEAQLDCDSQTNLVVWSAFCKYFFRKGATTAIDGVEAQQFRRLDNTYAIVKDSPVGTIAGGAISYARGWVPINVNGADASDYSTIPSAGGSPVEPPTFRNRAVTGLASGYKVFLARRSSPGFALLNEFTLAAGNNSGDGDLVLSATIPGDKPSTGFVRVFDDAGNEDRYAYTAINGATLTLSGTLAENYSSGNSAYIPYIDETATGASISKALQYVADRDVVLNVRLGSGSGKIEPFVSNFTLTDADSSVPATAIADAINNN